MEDTFCVAFQSEVQNCATSSGHGDDQQSDDQSSVENDASAANQGTSERRRKYIYAGIFDGHGGREAAIYARDHLLQNIVSQKDFWAEGDDDAVLRAIREGFLTTHYSMLKELGEFSFSVPFSRPFSV